MSFPAPSFKRHPAPSSLRFVASLLRRLDLLYYQYEVTFSLYVMTPGEKLACNTLVLGVLSLLAFAVAVYLPPLWQALVRAVAVANPTAHYEHFLVQTVSLDALDARDLGLTSVAA